MLGAHNIKAEQEEGRVSVNTMMFFTHPAYNPSLLQNDIALIHLINPVQFTNKIRPVCLPSSDETNIAFEGQKVNLEFDKLQPKIIICVTRFWPQDGGDQQIMPKGSVRC